MCSGAQLMTSGYAEPFLVGLLLAGGLLDCGGSWVFIAIILGGSHGCYIMMLWLVEGHKAVRFLCKCLHVVNRLT
jgi:hypothetical protein